MADIQKDLVLSPNEYSYVLDETKGNVQCNVGPHKMSLSQSDKLVRFDQRRKRFVTVEKYSEAIMLFTTAPEGWYVALKNPVAGNRHPQAGTSNAIPENIEIGRKINIPGPASFALYPGQMAEVIQGHTLRSNQYLIARVYDADSLNSTREERVPDEEDRAAEPKFINGQILIIKGTECSFYIPPTGIEVKAIDNNPANGYVRDAVTLERLEYCILKDEDGEKRYVHGPDVVFPEPTETFVVSPKGGYVFRAIELSKISGVYVKVIAEYTEKDANGNSIVHPVGEEMFITGDTQMIYYPRPEHAVISYDNKIMHHAIAIPEGEGRYVMNRLTGEIKTVKGPAMYLPDPRTEVVVKRKLTPRQCKLWYPGNEEALNYNNQLSEKSVEKQLKAVDLDSFTSFCTATADNSMMANLEAKANISRGTSYTKPRTITLDNKYDGVVTVDVWTGYAVNVISKDGTRKVECGPRTVLLDYDQTLETVELSTGRPKTKDRVRSITYLRYENNKVSDIVSVKTADYADVDIEVSYLVSFDTAQRDKWFAVNNYIERLTDWARSRIKEAARKLTLTELCEDYHNMVVEAISDNTEVEGKSELHRFSENGMYISDVEVTEMHIDNEELRVMVNVHQKSIIDNALKIDMAKGSAEVERQITELNRQKVALKEEYAQYKALTEAATKEKAHEIEVTQRKAEDAEVLRRFEIEKEIDAFKEAAHMAKLEAEKLDNEAEINYRKALADVEAEREAKAAQAMQTVISAIGPDLAVALSNQGNQKTVQAIAESISPYAVANGTSVAEAVNTLLRGSGLDKFLNTVVVDK